MTILAYLLLLTGTLLLFFGLRLIIKFLNLKTIFYSEHIKNEAYNLKITSQQNLFGVYFVGGKSVKGNIKITVTNSDGVVIPVNKNLIMLRSFIKGKPAVEAYNFACKSGDHTIKLENTEQLEIRKSMLKSRQLFEKPVNIRLINLAVKETMSAGTIVLMTLSPIFGFFIIAQGLIVLLS